jgi:fatty acid desaturase
LATATATYPQATGTLRHEIATAVPTEELKALHKVSGWRHAVVAARQVLVGAVAVAVILRWPHVWYAWVPASVLLGFVIFSFTVLLHEVVHKTVFKDRESRWYGPLGVLYGITSGLAASQFTRWHLDHHDHLGTTDRDPKRHHLTPKIVRRWFKALYLTPALFPIYFRAAAREASTYPDDLRRSIRRERLGAIGFHLALLGTLWATLGFGMALRLHVIPVFFVFPVAFTINRLGQHYDIRPEDPALWGTVLEPSRAWDWIFLWSGYHLEHHYFPRVPMYRLRRLRRDLQPFFDARGARQRTYGGLLWDWFVRNRTPHTDWSAG